MVYGLVARHGGRLDVSSTPAQGTRVVIQLPAEPPDVPAPPEEDDARGEAPEAAANGPHPGGEDDG